KLGEHAEAAEWFSRYIQLERNPASVQLYEASMKLAKSLRAIGKIPQSIEALKFAMARELTVPQRTRAAIELARTEAAGQSYVRALAALQGLPATPHLTDDEIEVLLLNSQIHCEIGMPDKAARMLQNAMDRAYSRDRAAVLAVPLARALVQMREAEKAADILARTLANIRPSAVADEIFCTLAEINVILGRYTEAISLSTRLIASKPSDEIVDRAFRIMGDAYAGMNQYDKAAMAYAGRFVTDEGGGI
ncbi:MAG TPA: tetratricopeptide repeat protein, partial [Sedimentisphaerales bacterium]|nr:tetratricopeptide repeat protein [Sedimentisphaerales bacterium]